jgi:GntR family transcriptional regulator
MTDSTSVMPRYHQVAAVLRQQILDSHLPAASQLPTEGELAAEFAVSIATVRQALQILVRDGLVVRKAGRGTFVSGRGHHDLDQRFQGSFVDAFEESHRTTSRRLEIMRDHAFPEPVAEALQMASPRGSAVWRTRTLNSEPISHSIAYLADWITELPSIAKLKKRPLLEYLLEGGIEIDSVVRTIRAVLAGPRVSAELEVELGSAVVQVDSLVRDVRGRPVELARNWYRADRFEYTATLHLVSSASGPRFVHATGTS